MKRYWRFLIPAVAVVAVMVFLLATLSSNLVYFKTPTEIADQAADPDARLRLGGEVAPGTVSDTTDGVAFTVTDGRMTVEVIHSGAPQDLFQEGIGVILEGNWDGRVFHSDTMLVKHDEQYRTEDGEEYEPGDYVPPADG
jgi:cytochrome c-type biogenesis protein CcmE